MRSDSSDRRARQSHDGPFVVVTSRRLTSQGSFWIETLGCPKNAVDSEKLAGIMAIDGRRRAPSLEEADLIVVNTCAFIEEARKESVEAIFDAAARKRSPSTQLVVTGCMAERYGGELAALMPEVDLVAGFGESLVPPQRVNLRRRPSSSFDLLNLPRPPAEAPWAYLKIAEGCDRACGFCAIPQFRGPQRSRTPSAILEEANVLIDSGARELVVVAQDPARYGFDRRPGGLAALSGTSGGQPLVALVEELGELCEWLRILYLYPSGLTDSLVDAMLSTGPAYFDLSLQHVSGPLLQRMRRWGDASRFLERIASIRALEPDAAFRSSFILGYPGETEDDQRRLAGFLEEAQLDWASFFLFSLEEGTTAAGLPDQVPASLASERLAECTELQDRITGQRREALLGATLRVLVDRPGVARSHREAPEIDGVVHVPRELAPGQYHDVAVSEVLGTDLRADRI